MENNLPLISIIIPFFNHKAYVKKAYDNVKQQTHSNWELIFVDNNSSDGSLAVAEDISAGDKRVLVITETKQGIAPARNAGLKKALGVYVSFLDIDDELVDTKFEKLLNVFDQYPSIGMAYGLTRRVYLPGKRVVIQDKGIVQEGLNNRGSLACDWIKTFYRLPQTGATLVKTEFAQKIGGFDEDLVLGNDDVGFHLKLAFNYDIGFINEDVVIYYRHEASAGAELNNMVTVHMRYLDAYAQIAVPLATTYKLQTGDNKPLKQALRNAYGDSLRVIFDSENRSVKKTELQELYKIDFKFPYSSLINKSDKISQSSMKFINKIVYRLF